VRARTNGQLAASAAHPQGGRVDPGGLQRVGDHIDAAFKATQPVPTSAELRRLFQLDHDVDDLPLTGTAATIVSRLVCPRLH
jgi:hypothetical protein